MENANISENVSLQKNALKRSYHVFKKFKSFIIAGVLVILILSALFFARGFFVAARVNGSLISRLAVIKELEKQGGKQALEALINRNLVETELNKQKVSVTKEEIDEQIKKIEAQIVGKGSTLKDVLAMRGMSEENLREQIAIDKRLEKLLASKITVTDAEVDAYIKSSKAAPPKNVKTEDFRKQVSEFLKQQKLQQEGQKWMSDLKAGAKINYYVHY